MVFACHTHALPTLSQYKRFQELAEHRQGRSRPGFFLFCCFGFGALESRIAGSGAEGRLLGSATALESRPKPRKP